MGASRRHGRGVREAAQRDRGRAEPSARRHLPEPGGAFYAFPNVTGLGLPRRAVADHFLHAAGVACLDGAGFGAAGEGYLRFSYANSVDAIREALDAMEASLPELEA